MELTAFVYMMNIDVNLFEGDLILRIANETKLRSRVVLNLAYVGEIHYNSIRRIEDDQVPGISDNILPYNRLDPPTDEEQ